MQFKMVENITMQFIKIIIYIKSYIAIIQYKDFSFYTAVMLQHIYTKGGAATKRKLAHRS